MSGIKEAFERRATEKTNVRNSAANPTAVLELISLLCAPATPKPEGNGSLWDYPTAPDFKPKADGWVRCSERLPTHSNPVQAITNDYPSLGVAVVPARYVDGNGWTDIDNTDRDGDESPLSEVVAWREMCEIPAGLKRPQPPQEGEGDE